MTISYRRLRICNHQNVKINYCRYPDLTKTYNTRNVQMLSKPKAMFVLKKVACIDYKLASRIRCNHEFKSIVHSEIKQSGVTNF